MSAHFHVINMASARTSPAVSDGWNLIPPLKGPRALLWLHANAFEHPRRPVVHADGHEHAVLAHRRSEQVAGAAVEAQS